jgi:hypothetical protein
MACNNPDLKVQIFAVVAVNLRCSFLQQLI